MTAASLLTALEGWPLELTLFSQSTSFGQPRVKMLQAWLFSQLPKYPSVHLDSGPFWVSCLASFPLLNFIQPEISDSLKNKFEPLYEKDYIWGTW